MIRSPEALYPAIKAARYECRHSEKDSPAQPHADSTALRSVIMTSLGFFEKRGETIGRPPPSRKQCPY